jgi:hypothetical protein
LRNILGFFLVSLLLFSGQIHAQEDAARYFGLWEKKYSGLRDYTVDVKVHFDVEGFKLPDMQGKLYCKAPDKIKIESKRVFFFPKDGGYFNPFMFKKEDFEIKLLEHSTYDGRKAVKLKLTPKKTSNHIRDYVWTIDLDRNLIREMDISLFEGREVKAVMTYASFNDFELPMRIELMVDIPFNESIEIKDFGQPPQETKRINGKIEITYSKYKVNSGLSDKIFKGTEFPNVKGSFWGKSE